MVPAEWQGQYLDSAVSVCADHSRLAQARQGSIVNRKRQHRKTISHDSFPREYDFLSAEKLDAEIRNRCQKGQSHPSHTINTGDSNFI